MTIPVFGEIGVLPQEDDAVTPTIAFGDGDTGIFESADDTLRISMGGAIKYTITAALMQAAEGTSWQLDSSSATSTNPTLLPYRIDDDTGIGWNSADNLSLIAGGAEAIRAEDPADLAATETSLWLYDLDNGAIQQVTVGAADSGGSGFKVLRIPN